MLAVNIGGERFILFKDLIDNLACFAMQHFIADRFVRMALADNCDQARNRRLLAAAAGGPGIPFAAMRPSD